MKNFARGITPELPVSDLRSSVEFYTQKLGFTLVWIWQDNYACIGNGEVQLFLSKTDKPVHATVNYIFVDNADEVYAACLANGITVSEELRLQPWGMREFSIADNNGHIFRIGHGEKETREIEEFTTLVKS